MSTKNWMHVAAVLAALALALVARARSTPANSARPDTVDLSHEPIDERWNQWTVQQPSAGNERFSAGPAGATPSPGKPVALAQYQDDVHPDEDLLLSPDRGTTPPTAPNAAQPRTPATQPQEPQDVRQTRPPLPPDTPSTHPPARLPPRQVVSPTNQPPAHQALPAPSAPPRLSGPQLSAAEGADTAQPSGQHEVPPEALPSAEPTAGAGQERLQFDPNIPPAADEDLLQGQQLEVIPPGSAAAGPAAESSADRPSAGSLERLPVRPDIPVPARPEGLPLTPAAPAPGAATGPAPQLPARAPYPDVPSQAPSPRPPAAWPAPSTGGAPQHSQAADPHTALFAESLYPSAKKCRECHQQIYDEWAISGHAYASISPMFQKFEQTITSLTRGTLGYFCMRCHAPVATALGFPRYGSLVDDKTLPDSAREGVTCIACHRVQEQYGKVNGERRIEPGGIHDPVFGTGDGSGLADVIRRRNDFKVKTSPHESGPGQDIHQAVIQFPQLGDSSFCASCHQVAVSPGIELEVVWEQYRASPACKQGISCQDCHMGSVPGVAAGYDTAPVAIVNSKPVSPERKHSNHEFHGPGYSIAHPGIFPFNKDAEKWTAAAWLKFDWRSEWGRDAFEDAVDDGRLKAAFPPEWDNADDRYDAREVINANLKRLLVKREMRQRLYENSSHVEGPMFDTAPRAGQSLEFHYRVSNLSTGHNMPSGSLGAQPQLWLNVVLTGPQGQRLWESGYVDANGDLCDLHSLEVAAGRAMRDVQLFNLQTKFLISHVKGTDREMYLPLNVDIDQLPFIRPSAFPISVMNHPPFIRMEAHSIPALGCRKAKYKVPGHLLQQPGRYRLTVRMRSRSEPIYFMRFCQATAEMERSVNEWMIDFHQHATEFWVP